MRTRLRSIVEIRSLKYGEFTLSSGETSTFYFNLKETILDPEASLLIADLVLDVVADDPPTYLGGLEMGAVPIAACVGMRSAQLGMPIRPFYVRKAKKNHGTQTLIDVQLTPRKHAVIIEDVTTTGGSVMQAANILRDLGLEVNVVVTILDRQEGAEDLLKVSGLRLVSLMTAGDFNIR